MDKSIAIIGGGPAGLMAAERLSQDGFKVTIYDRKPSVGRKFLIAGRGGLNLTHSEPLDSFVQKYKGRQDVMTPMIKAYPPNELRAWCEGLGEATFIGSSGRIFPTSFKASPLMRAWINRLEANGVRFRLGYEWTGWDGENLVFIAGGETHSAHADATLLALGGGSWPRLGSDGGWVPLLKGGGVDIADLKPSNCGFQVEWSDVFIDRFAGKPLKSVTVSVGDQRVQGEVMICRNGVEGGAIYALSSTIREAIEVAGHATISIDLKPDLSQDETSKRLSKPRRAMSLSNFLRKTLNLSDVAVGLLMERPDRQDLSGYSADKLADIIKCCQVTSLAAFPIEKAISSAGGVKFSEVDEGLMLIKKPGVFVAGEMLDWEAPTGGYLLQACMAMGVHVSSSMKLYLK